MTTKQKREKVENFYRNADLKKVYKRIHQWFDVWGEAFHLVENWSDENINDEYTLLVSDGYINKPFKKKS